MRNINGIQFYTLIFFSYSKTDRLNEMFLSSHKCAFEKYKISVRKLSNITLVGRKKISVWKDLSTVKKGKLSQKKENQSWYNGVSYYENFTNSSNEIVVTSVIFVRVNYWSVLFPSSFKVHRKNNALKIVVRHLNKAITFYSVMFTKY